VNTATHRYCARVQYSYMVNRPVGVTLSNVNTSFAVLRVLGTVCFVHSGVSDLGFFFLSFFLWGGRMHDAYILGVAKEGMEDPQSEPWIFLQSGSSG